jgi:hypothetical protein
VTGKHQDFALISTRTLFDCPQIRDLEILGTTHNTLSMKTNRLKAVGNEILTAPIRRGYRAAGNKGFS